MKRNPFKAPSESAILAFGSLTAVLLLVVLLNGLRSNLRSELNEGGHRVDELALNVAQIFRAPLRASANAMTFLAEESERLQRTAPQQRDVLLKDVIAETLRRQPQLVNVAFTSTAMPGGTSEASGSANDTQTSCDMYLPSVARKVCWGAMKKTPRGWMLPLAVPLEGGRWVVGDVQVATLGQAVANMARAGDAFFEVVDTHRQVIVEGGNAADATAVAYSSEPWWIRRLFGIRSTIPLQTSVAVGLFPFTVNAGMTYQQALVSWRRLAFEAASFYFLYLSAFACLLGIVSRNARVQRHLIQNLQAKTSELHASQRAGRTAIWTLGAFTPGFRCTEEAEEIFGLPLGKITASAKEFLRLVVPADRRWLIEQVKVAWRSDGRLKADFRIQRTDGSMRRLSADGLIVVDETGARHLTGTVVDVTEQWKARQQQLESEHRFHSLFEHNPLPFWVFDTSSLRFLEVNAAAVRSYGYTRDEFLRMTILDIRDPGDHQNVIADVASLRELPHRPKVWAHRTKEGKVIDVRIHSADIVFNDRSARLVLAEDVTAHLADQRELAFRASHDLLTKQPNQRALMARMDALLAEKGNFDVAYLQLLGMDAIADTFGINVASGILQTVATRLAGLVSDNEFLANVNHEAFAIVSANGKFADAKLQAFGKCVAEPVHYEDTQHQIEIMIGVAGHPQDGAQSNELIAHAALAAHAHLGSDQSVHHFEPPLAQRSRERLNFAAKLRQAVARHEFELHFQPITSYPDMRLIGLEALIRWPQRDGTLISPSSFIPICEESGLIVPLGRWVLSQAAKASRELSEMGFDDIPISVNVSPAELHNDEFVDNLVAVRKAYSLSRGAIHIELTESSLIEHKNKTIAIMKQLREDGFPIALDDFGTGYSSFSYLSELPIDAMKIDQAFVRHVDRDARSAMICEAIIALGKSINVRVIAEGIERPSQYHWLYEHACDGAQGFYLGKPRRLSELLKLFSADADPRSASVTR